MAPSGPLGAAPSTLRGVPSTLRARAGGHAPPGAGEAPGTLSDAQTNEECEIGILEGDPRGWTPWHSCLGE